MTWAPSDIRRLRLRLGWSAAEFGRQLGCKTELVLQWEDGKAKPDSDAVHQFGYLHACVEFNSYRVAQLPLAEIIMAESSLSQVTHDTINRWPADIE